MHPRRNKCLDPKGPGALAAAPATIHQLPATKRRASLLTARAAEHPQVSPRGGDQPTDDVLPRLLNEREAAILLRVKPATVRAERIRGKIGYTRIGARIFYTHQQIVAYVERQAVSACASDVSSTLVKSETIGSAESLAATAPTTPGAAHGTMSALDRHAVSALARQTFRRQASASRLGLSPTSEATRPLRTKF